MNKRKIAILIVLSVCILGLYGCGKKIDEQPITVNPFEPITEIVEGQPNVYLITKAKNNNYWDTVAECIGKAGDAQNVNIYFSCSENETQWKAQVELLEEAVRQEADAIIIAPDDSSNLSEPICAVYEKNIPIILIDTTITAECYDICFMTDNLWAGEQAAKAMLEQLRQAGYSDDEYLEIAMQAGSCSSQTINERMAGFSQYWMGNAPKQWNILKDVAVNDGDVELAYNLTVELLDKYPNLKGMFGCNNGSTVGLCRAVTQTMRDDVVVVGFDFSEDIEAMIRDPEFYASTMLQCQNVMGERSVEMAKRLISGEVATQKFVDTGVVTVNYENIDSSDIVELTGK